MDSVLIIPYSVVVFVNVHSVLSRCLFHYLPDNVLVVEQKIKIKRI